MIFDDTSEHEAWNQSNLVRIVLLLDFKKPISLPPHKEHKRELEAEVHS